MPQLEDGYTRIANELLEALARFRVPGEARQVFDLIIRKTYGFNKKEDVISLSQFEAGTTLKKTYIIRAIKKLLALNIISKKGNGDRVKYGINKNYSSWLALPKKVTYPKKDIAVSKKGKKTYPKKGHTIDSTNTKDTLTKEKARLGDVWIQWEKHRKEKRQKLTPTTEERQLKKLSKYPLDVATKMLEYSMDNGYTGIFPLKESKTSASYAQAKQDRTIANIKEGLKNVD